MGNQSVLADDLKFFLSEFVPFSQKYFRKKIQDSRIYPPLIKHFYKDLYDFTSGGKKLRAFLVWIGYRIGITARGPVSRFLPASARSKQKSIRDQKDNVELRAVGNPFTTATPRIADILSIALAYELLHSFLLIHDDIIDESSTRRGRTTIHRRYEKKTSRHYGMSQAIVLGDIACFEALDLVNCSSFTDSQKVACFAKIISTIIETGYGEGLDVEYSNRWTNFNNIRQMTELKTAKYTFVGPLTVGAILGKANKSQIDALSKLGLLIGLAFQIQDDILGVFGKEKVVGKSVLGDLREGKNTLLIHKTKEMLSGKKREELARIWGKKNAGNRDLKRVQKLIINSGALFWAENEKAKLVKSAKVYIKSQFKHSHIFRINDIAALGNGLGAGPGQAQVDLFSL